MAQVFQISDGTTTVDLLNPLGPYSLQNWDTGINQWKDGGIFTQNSQSQGSILVFKEFDTFDEKLTIHISGNSQDQLLANFRVLFNLLERGINYYLYDFGDQTYIAVKGENETNTRYAVVVSYAFGDLPPQFSGGFQVGGLLSGTKVGSVYGEIDLILKRGIWLENVPGTLISAYIDTGATGQNTTVETIDPITPLRIFNTNLDGDVYPLGRIELINGASPDENKVVVGLRTRSRGTGFFPVLPFSDTGLPSGISIPDLGGGAWINDADAPDTSWTGRVRRVTLTTGFVNQDPIWFLQTIIIDSSISSNWVGRYRCFVRAKNNSAEFGRIICRLGVGIDGQQTQLGVHAAVIYPSTEMSSASGTEVLDIGVVELPASLNKSGTIGDISLSVELKDTTHAHAPDAWVAYTSYAAAEFVAATTVPMDLIFECTTSPVALTAWAATTAYTAGVYRRATAGFDAYVFECTTGGTSGGTEPAWSTVEGATTTDGTVTWTTRLRGQSGGTEPTWDTTIGNTTNDGTVQWTTRANPNIPTVDLYDITLIPADECIIEADARHNPTDKIVMDQISSPEETVNIWVENSGGEVTYRPTYGGSSTLTIPKGNCGLFIFSYQRAYDDANNVYYNDTNYLTTNGSRDVRVYKLNRYLLPRGNV